MLRYALVLISALLTLSACSESHAGTLEAITNGTGSGFGDFTGGTDKSFGVFLCTEGGSVELESIDPIGLEGDVEFLGASVYTSPDEFVGAADGYPPNDVDVGRTEPFEGAVVDVDCTQPEGADRVQLLIGLERTGPGGGAISGVALRTSATEPLFIDYDMLMCGDQLEYCELLEEQDS